MSNSPLNLDELSSLLPKRVSVRSNLPSKGLFYDKTVIPDGCVELFPMSAREEKILAGASGPNVTEVINLLLERCLVTKIDPKDLLSTDSFYLLLQLRANSYGDDYTFPITCYGCKTYHKYTVKVPGDLILTESLPTDKEPFDCKLPKSGLTVQFRLLRNRDTSDIQRYSEMETKRGTNPLEGDPAYLYRYAKHLVSVEDRKVDLLTALTFIEKLPAKDLKTLSKSIDKKTPGVSSLITKNCIKCDKELSAVLPSSADFFYFDTSGEE